MYRVFFFLIFYRVFFSSNRDPITLEYLRVKKDTRRIVRWLGKKPSSIFLFCFHFWFRRFDFLFFFFFFSFFLNLFHFFFAVLFFRPIELETLWFSFSSTDDEFFSFFSFFFCFSLFSFCKIGGSCRRLSAHTHTHSSR